MKQINSTTKFQAYRILTILMLMFVVPITLAWILYYGNVHLNWGTVNNGYLFRQPLEMSQLSIKAINGNPASGYTPQKWNILYLNAEDNAQPLAVLDKVNRIRLALGKDYSRVRESYVFNYDPHTNNINQTVAKNFQQAAQFALSNASIQKLLRQIPQSSSGSREAIFIVDPRGFVMLGYHPDVRSEYIYKDLERLLKYSTIG